MFNIPNNNGALAKQSVNHPFNKIINLNSLNSLKDFDNYIREVNKRIIDKGLFIACCETGELVKKDIFLRLKFPLNHILFTTYFIYHRIFPKLLILNKIHKFFSKGKSIAMSKVELFGRLYYCGFELLSEKEIGKLNYFVVQKVKAPSIDKCPSYYPLIKLKRLGKNGKKIDVYKFRTMHPYSEYLQDYIYKQNNLDTGGKIKDDFRVSHIGTFMRKIWIDEIPMLYNLFKGDLKLFGVRPISEQYYNLYTEELKQLRKKHKPGLIPPFYADLPKNIDEIIESEKKYLLEYEKKPLRTDCK
ncbi:MAG: sugar transferase, partial [Chloroflexia bacterium]|nr:sugar transferase [Chloroflexia bacterium]